ncbi:MAG: hypothetical protein JW904_11905 [Spirochaetales bacterium]|nr:hypothetical protein [Spirochaetales bacterium]
MTILDFGMKKLVLLSLFCLASLNSYCVNIAVSNFELSGTGVAVEHNKLALDLFTGALTRTPGITVLDRRKTEQILREQELSLSDLVDSNTALKTGKLLGAAYILAGNIIGLGDSFFISIQLIDNTTGAVAMVFDSELAKLNVSLLKGFVDNTASMIGSRFSSKSIGDESIASLWLTKSTGTQKKPILIYIMSTIEDSQDPNGQWYYGPQHLAPVTDELRKTGFGVVIHDRRTLKSLKEIPLTGYSQVWLLEGDGNPTVNPDAEDVIALYNYYLNGGSVWLSGENILNPVDTNWIEDINAFADPFGVQIEGVVIARELWLTVPKNDTHPLLSGVTRLVFDTEVGTLAIKSKSVKPLVFIDPGSRFLQDGLDVSTLFEFADPVRMNEIRNGREDWNYEWLLSENWEKVGPLAGKNIPCIALRDERNVNKGRFIIDSGWVLGWAFNGERGGIPTIGNDLLFLTNAASWLSPPTQ